MKVLAHLSDLHFGREDPAIVRGLLESLHAAAPEIIVVSGDFTQRAKKKQFRAARAFLNQMPQVPCLVVPGNHDVSTTNLFERAVSPLKRFRRYIASDLAPFLADEQVAIAGINSVRLLSTKDGRINRSQVENACRQFNQAPSSALRVVVTHHPIDLPAEDRKHPVLTRAAMAMAGFARCHVDLFLSGHLHSGLSLTTAARYPIPGYSAVVVHAGTAVSTRTRLEPNGWNIIQLGSDAIEIQRMNWNGRKFTPADRQRYVRRSSGWA